MTTFDRGASQPRPKHDNSPQITSIPVKILSGGQTLWIPPHWPHFLSKHEKYRPGPAGELDPSWPPSVLCSDVAQEVTAGCCQTDTGTTTTTQTLEALFSVISSSFSKTQTSTESSRPPPRSRPHGGSAGGPPATGGAADHL